MKKKKKAWVENFTVNGNCGGKKIANWLLTVRTAAPWGDLSSCLKRYGLGAADAPDFLDSRQC